MFPAANSRGTLPDSSFLAASHILAFLLILKVSILAWIVLAEGRVSMLVGRSPWDISSLRRITVLEVGQLKIFVIHIIVIRIIVREKKPQRMNVQFQVRGR